MLVCGLPACNKPKDGVAAETAMPTPAPLDASTGRDATVDAPARANPLVYSLPPIKSGEEREYARFTVTVDEHSLFLDGKKLLPLPSDQSQGFDAEYKRSGKSDLYLVALADAIKRERYSGRRAVLSNAPQADASPDPPDKTRVELGPATTYRVLTEILFTLGQAEVIGYNLVAPRAGSTFGDLSEIRVTPPRAKRDAGAAPPDGLGLVVVLVRDGIGVKVRGGNIAPGCTDTGAGLTLKTEGAGYRFAELGQCLRRLKDASPKLNGETTMTFTAGPGVAYSDVLMALDAARGAQRELYPDVVFGIAR